MSALCTGDVSLLLYLTRYKMRWWCKHALKYYQPLIFHSTRLSSMMCDTDTYLPGSNAYFAALPA